MRQRELDVLFTVTFLGGFFWLSFAAGATYYLGFPWDLIEFLLAAGGTGLGVWGWWMAKQQLWAGANLRIMAFLTLLITWAAWVPMIDYY